MILLIHYSHVYTEISKYVYDMTRTHQQLAGSSGRPALPNLRRVPSPWRPARHAVGSNSARPYTAAIDNVFNDNYSLKYVTGFVE